MDGSPDPEVREMALGALYDKGGAQFLGLSLVANAIAGSMHRLSGYAQRHRVATPYRKNEKAFVRSFPNTLRTKSALAGVATSSAKGKNYRRRSKNTCR